MGRSLRWFGLLALACAPATAHADGLKLVATKQLDPRLQELTFTTPALSPPTTKVRVLLPSGYDPAARTRYPVLYLLHGAIDDDSSWTAKGDAEHTTAGLPLIVVMPDAGGDGWYSDHYNLGAFGPPQWETYHIHQLLPWIDAHYRTIAARRGRATTGLSMGGFGAVSYAARHPDLFVAAASFSGALNTNLPAPSGQPDAPLDGSLPYAYWGPYQTQEARWRGHDPWDLAENLRGVALTIRTGNGDDPNGNFSDVTEYQVHADSISFDQRLTQLHEPHVFEDYGNGTHTWPFWQKDFQKTLPWLMDVFAHPPARPARVTFTAVEPSYRVYGWRVALQRPVLEFSTLAKAGRHGFTLSGSGAGTVTTPARYRPGRRFRVAGHILRANAAGRLRIPVGLGPADTAQEYTPGAATSVRRVHVTISHVR